MAQAPTLAGPGDQPRHVSHGELGPSRRLHHAQVRLQGGKRVVGDFRASRGDPRNECALSGVRESHKGYVSHEPEFQPQPALLAVLALLGEAWSSSSVAKEPGVTVAASARLGS